MHEKTKAKREKLRNISDVAKKMHNEILQDNVITVNDMIVNYIYDTKSKLQFKTFKSWKKEGFKIKKGSKAYLLWGRPLKGKAREKVEKEKSEDEYKFFPLAYIFSSEQVTKE